MLNICFQCKKCKDITISDLLVSNQMDPTVFWIQYHHGSEMIPVIVSLTLANADTVLIVHHPDWNSWVRLKVCYSKIYKSEKFDKICLMMILGPLRKWEEILLFQQQKIPRIVWRASLPILLCNEKNLNLFMPFQII